MPQKQGHKLSFQWVRPRIVEYSVNGIVFFVKNLVNYTLEKVHALRIVLYRHDFKGLYNSQNTHKQITKLLEIIDIGESERELWLR